MQVSCFGTELESAGPPGALILNNAYPTVDSRQTEFECGPSHEWRETRLLTIQITGERPTVETDSATAAGSGLHCWQASREARPDARAHAQTDAHVGTLTNGCTHSDAHAHRFPGPSAVVRPAQRASPHKLYRAPGRRALAGAGWAAACLISY